MLNMDVLVTHCSFALSDDLADFWDYALLSALLE